MKTHTTNYYNTFIEVADDTKATQGTTPPAKEPKTVAAMQYDIIMTHPYTYTSDDVLFQIYAERNTIPSTEYSAVRAQFFSKGQPCLRTSPLTKSYGFGIHSNSEGKIALYGMETEAYQHYITDGTIKKVKAMQSSKAK